MTKIKSLFLVCHTANNGDGIGKKILAQMDALNRTGFDVTLSHLDIDNDGTYDRRLIGNEILEEYKNSFLIPKRWKWRFGFKSILNHVRSKNIKFLYIRYTHFANPNFIGFLKSAKRIGVVIFLEIPTYPYDGEYRDAGRLLKASLLIERISRKFLRGNVDRILTYSNDLSIFGIQTIQIDNGIDLSRTPIKKTAERDNAFSIITVSSMEYWHGYDRLIRGLREYLDKPGSIDISLNFAGNLSTTSAIEYKNLVSKLKLDQHVNFLGYLSGTELDTLFDNADVAVGALGVHRKSLYSFKSLKNREYCARGVPFAYSGDDITFDNQSFAMKLPANDSSINIPELIELGVNAKHLAKDMRAFAERTLSWDTQMQILELEYLKMS